MRTVIGLAGLALLCVIYTVNISPAIDTRETATIQAAGDRVATQTTTVVEDSIFHEVIFGAVFAAIAGFRRQ